MLLNLRMKLVALVAIILVACLVSVNGSALEGKVAKRQASSVCIPSRFYCGNELQHLGYTNTDDNSLYKCQDHGDAHFYDECPKCVPGSSGQGAYCECEIGSLYCGHELTNFNFYFATVKAHTLYRCSKANLVTPAKECTSVCIDKAEGDSMCGKEKTCDIGVKYCGQEVRTNKVRNSVVDPHSLYECDLHGDMMDYIQDCPNGCTVKEASDSFCDTTNRVATRPPLCTPARFYCGAELAEMGYSTTESHMLYRCSFDGDGHVALHCDRAECTPSPQGASYCACVPADHYCGYELLKMNFPPSDGQPIDDHSLYRCTASDHADWDGRCAYGCMGSPLDGRAHCNAARPNKLPTGHKYCGHQLGPSHHHPGWAPQRLYVIAAGGSAVPLVNGDCPSGCVGLDDGQSHCDATDHIAERP